MLVTPLNLPELHYCSSMKKPLTKPKQQTVSAIGENGEPIVAVIETPRRGPRGFHFPIALAERFGKVGLSYSELAEILGISKRTVQREFDKGEKSEFVTAYKKALGGTKTTLRERLLERSKVSDTALIFALKNYCRFSDRPQDEEKEKVQIEITSRGKPVKTPKWLDPWKEGE